MKQLTKDSFPKYTSSSYNSIPEKQANQRVGEKDQNRHFFIENKKHIIRYSTSFIIREMQIKTIMRFHLIPVIMAIIEKSTNNNCWRGCGERERSCTVGGSVY